MNSTIVYCLLTPFFKHLHLWHLIYFLCIQLFILHSYWISSRIFIFSQKRQMFCVAFKKFELHLWEVCSYRYYTALRPSNTNCHINALVEEAHEKKRSVELFFSRSKSFARSSAFTIARCFHLAAELWKWTTQLKLLQLIIHTNGLP